MSFMLVIQTKNSIETFEKTRLSEHKTPWKVRISSLSKWRPPSSSSRARKNRKRYEAGQHWKNTQVNNAKTTKHQTSLTLVLMIQFWFPPSISARVNYGPESFFVITARFVDLSANDTKGINEGLPSLMLGQPAPPLGPSLHQETPFVLGSA